MKLKFGNITSNVQNHFTLMCKMRTQCTGSDYYRFNGYAFVSIVEPSNLFRNKRSQYWAFGCFIWQARQWSPNNLKASKCYF